MSVTDRGLNGGSVYSNYVHTRDDMSSWLYALCVWAYIIWFRITYIVNYIGILHMRMNESLCLYIYKYSIIIITIILQKTIYTITNINNKQYSYS